MRTWVQSLALFGGLRVWCRLQMWLGSMLLWLWCRPAAVAPIRPITWEPLYATGAALKRKKKKDRKRKKGRSYTASKTVSLRQEDFFSPRLTCQNTSQCIPKGAKRPKASGVTWSTPRLAGNIAHNFVLIPETLLDTML